MVRYFCFAFFFQWECLFEGCLLSHQVQQRNLGVAGRIFAIETHRSKTGKGNECKLKVNFLPEIITLSKEVSRVRPGARV